MLKFLFWILGIIAILGIIYAVGPKVPEAKPTPVLPNVTSDLTALEKEVNSTEKATPDLKPDNEARIIWADSSKKEKTTYSIVYIHGFGASWAEGDPIHKDLAKKYGANLYLARMHDAGIADTNALQDLTPENFLEGAKRALAIGKVLGDSVIVIGTSAGGLLTTYLAATHPEIKGVVLYSPCIEVKNGTLKLITRPWGKQILHKAIGEYSKSRDTIPERAQFWLQGYHTNGLITLQQMMDAISRPEVFEKIKMPIFVGYYYKNEEEQDQVVSVKAIEKMFPELGTPDDQKVLKAFPESGDHVIASRLRSKDVNGVFEATDLFFQQKLHLKPVENSVLQP
ncbi:alpha/beta hydrolase [Dyadobacter fanqingshengii]|uniref:Alpha/beta hydrolase n=1 Tax=Dyadobacter fanqingshengii TaxID=2906443 RepID=A0A9X1PE27_9BACT|nr:acyl-CoA thioester hydrolase/BAAT C-terminal domain-containing protein [Dyadobacter fanqingshengii]MCF0042434.1 alpha/beta hydrolase [Dyadobacter fanqingshengii]USJ35042.1 alpha/beta hydrolase [Dyadobacter fanqingshengii]